MLSRQRNARHSNTKNIHISAAATRKYSFIKAAGTHAVNMERAPTDAMASSSSSSLGEALSLSSSAATATTCVYLDYNATTPIPREVSDAAMRYLKGDCFGNPSSDNPFSRQARAMLLSSRRSILKLLGDHDNGDDDDDDDDDDGAGSVGRVVYTSGGTEADLMALRSGITMMMAKDKTSNGGEKLPHVVSTTIEHVAVLKALATMEREGTIDVTLVEPDAYGIVGAEQVVDAITSTTVMVSVMHSNNEVGSLQPIGEIARRVKRKKHDVIVHTDAAQSVGKVKLDVKNELSHVDLITVVGHKFGAPKGVGCLWIRSESCAALPPLLEGGGQEGGMRAGTENVLGISAMGAAAQLILDDGIDVVTTHLKTMRDALATDLENALRKHGIAQGYKLNGPCDETRHDVLLPNECVLPNTLSIVLPVDANTLINVMKDDVACSAGSACHAGSHAMSHVLKAMGMSMADARGTLRLSTGRHSTREEMARAAEIIARTALKLATN